MSYDVPPTGTRCEDCKCCLAGVYEGKGKDRIAICMACFGGELCAPQKLKLAAASGTSPVNAGTALNTLPMAAPKPLCLGGCGKPAFNDKGYAWGHAKGCTRVAEPVTMHAPAPLPPPAPPTAPTPAPEPESETITMPKSTSTFKILPVVNIAAVPDTSRRPRSIKVQFIALKKIRTAGLRCISTMLRKSSGRRLTPMSAGTSYGLK